MPFTPIHMGPGILFKALLQSSFSHVYLDSIMHADVQPFYPFILTNSFVGLVSISVLHKICLYGGLVGAVIYYFINWQKNSWEQ